MVTSPGLSGISQVIIVLTSNIGCILKGRNIIVETGEEHVQSAVVSSIKKWISINIFRRYSRLTCSKNKQEALHRPVTFCLLYTLNTTSQIISASPKIGRSPGTTAANFRYRSHNGISSSIMTHIICSTGSWESATRYPCPKQRGSFNN
ncbi:MAG: hypothetical protein JPMHGGIA_02814 [Saprospiraceae bacterium]|nr:hypothetical protein [Saprospiraceae bacterium]